MSNIRLNINGREVITAEGKTVLESALDAGIYIPHLCYHPNLKPAGACRLCIVEIEDMGGLPTSCTTMAVDGMVVKTKSPQIDRLRFLAMEFMLAGHPPDCTTCPKYLNCELQSLKQYIGITEELRIKRRPYAFPVNNSNPLLVHDFQRCILCGRCVRACYELRGVGIVSYIGCGRETIIGTAFNRLLADAGCVFCGACAEVCPTAAIRDKEGIIDDKKGKRASLIPCKYTCPAQIDVPRYIRLIHEEKYSAALAVIREKVPFPAVLGYVCNHPCELVCRRKEVNQAIAIKDLKRFAAKNDDKSWKKRAQKSASTNKRIAVIGSGPAGLTAAYYLAKKGHTLTVFEALPYSGGMLRVGIPEYRLSKAVLKNEIKEIEDSGVEIVVDSKVESIDILFEQGFNAVLVAIGTHRGQRLPIPGNDLKDVLVSMDFLKRVNLGEQVKVGKRVLVLGGGNVAFDCARVARRLGANEVHVACLEAGDTLLASEEEIEQAKEEGIIIHASHSFVRVLDEKGSVCGVGCLDVNSFEFDEEGELKITTVEGSEHVLNADTVIFAVGQSPDIPQTYNLNVVRGNLLEVDSETMVTSREGVFAAGDVVSGTTSVIEAIAAGRKVASSMDKYLGGDGVIDEQLISIEEPEAWIGRKQDFAQRERIAARLVPVEERLKIFEEMDYGYDEQDALTESARCLQCDLRLKIAKSKFWADYLSQ